LYCENAVSLTESRSIIPRQTLAFTVNLVLTFASKFYTQFLRITHRHAVTLNSTLTHTHSYTQQTHSSAAAIAKSPLFPATHSNLPIPTNTIATFGAVGRIAKCYPRSTQQSSLTTPTTTTTTSATSVLDPSAPEDIRISFLQTFLIFLSHISTIVLSHRSYRRKSRS